MCLTSRCLGGDVGGYADPLNRPAKLVRASAAVAQSVRATHS